MRHRVANDCIACGATGGLSMDDDSKRKLFPRRHFIKLTGLAAGALVVGRVGDPSFLPAQSVLPVAFRGRHERTSDPRQPAVQLEAFVDQLPIPRTMRITNQPGLSFYDVEMVPFRQKLHRDLAPTSLWGYNGAFPGPTFVARRGEPIRVLWRNGLPSKHPLPVDTTIHGAEADKPEVRTVVHLHGHKVLPESDGYPEAWFTNGFAETGPSFKNRYYQYPNDQRAA